MRYGWTELTHGALSTTQRERKRMLMTISAPLLFAVLSKQFHLRRPSNRVAEMDVSGGRKNAATGFFDDYGI